MHDLNELADAAKSGRQYVAQRRIEKFYRRAAPKPRAAQQKSYGPFAWGFGIAIGLCVGFTVFVILDSVLAWGIFFASRAISN